MQRLQSCLSRLQRSVERAPQRIISLHAFLIIENSNRTLLTLIYDRIDHSYRILDHSL